MRVRSVFAFTSFIAAFVLNPAYFAGCTTADTDSPGYQYGAKEMAGLANVANDSFEFEDGTTHYRVDLSIAPVGAAKHSAREASLFGATAYACGVRKLVATASACVDYSSMDVEGSMSLFRVGGADAGEDDAVVVQDIAVHGTLIVASLVLYGGDMSLSYKGGTLNLRSNDAKAFELSGFDTKALGPDKVAIAFGSPVR